MGNPCSFACHKTNVGKYGRSISNGYSRNALFVVVLVASPMLGLGLFLGLIIGILQGQLS